MTVPVISITDLDHPPEDPGGNVDLIMAYGLPELDLRAVILEARDPGIAAVTQLNAIFGRNVPTAWCPSTRMSDPTDRMCDAPPAQQRGIDLLIHALADSPEPVHLLSFGSARPVAVAYNRAPKLFREKVARVHLSAGTAMDPQAVIRIVDSGLPLSLYPVAADDMYDSHNTYWMLPDLKWIEEMHPWLCRYLGYTLGGRSPQPDFLRVLDDDAPADSMADIYHRTHSVWETAAWMQVAGRVLVRRTDGCHSIIPATEVSAGDTVIRNEQVPCTVRATPNGRYEFELGGGGRTSVFVRDDPFEYEQAMADALPDLYQSFRPGNLS
ncbi:hypothetical protein GCM10029976_080880 [Kribbella albertanoniae]|uniref:Inosine/uridine-preferring nucleoside hydrolase domain-containing protein n=1 Tax=Kribbella albertanoniae TaxID=1266829 RepID=A0A4R4P0L1_9ACTN|nr:hypothetical protein [Kribbella albertanoniae]TDC15034.1 hypothetical protein E1261_41010 [Kribbella albertanoniae]